MNKNNNCVLIGARENKPVNNLLYFKIQELVDKNSSFLVTETTGDLYNSLNQKLENAGYEVYCLDLRSPHNSDSWNALHFPYMLYKEKRYAECLDALESISSNIMLDEESLKQSDPFWAISAKDFLVGLSYCLFEDAKTEECVHLKSIQNMINEGMGKFGGSTYIKEYFGMKKDNNYGKQAASAVLQAPNETQSSIISVFNQKLKSITVKNAFLKNTCDNTVEFKNIIENKSAVFLRIEDEKTEESQYIHVFIKQLYEELIRDYYNEKRNSNTFSFIFNDFLCLGRIHDLEKMLMGAEKRNIEFIFSIYGVSALENIYSQELASSILGACNKYILFKNTDLKTLRYFKELLKFIGIKLKLDYEQENTVMEISLGGIRNINLLNYEIVSCISEIQWQEIETYKPVVFDIKEWVKEKKKSILLEMMNNQTEVADETKKRIIEKKERLSEFENLSPAERVRRLIENEDI